MNPGDEYIKQLNKQEYTKMQLNLNELERKLYVENNNSIALTIAQNLIDETNANKDMETELGDLEDKNSQLEDDANCYLSLLQDASGLISILKKNYKFKEEDLLEIEGFMADISKVV